MGEEGDQGDGGDEREEEDEGDEGDKGEEGDERPAGNPFKTTPGGRGTKQGINHSHFEFPTLHFAPCTGAENVKGDFSFSLKTLQGQSWIFFPPFSFFFFFFPF